jgi:hypothetical protein
MNVRFSEGGDFIGCMPLSLIALGIAMTYCGLAFHSLPPGVRLVVVSFES